MLARSNVDLLGWFTAEERHQCANCHATALVSVPEALASFCLACGAVWLEGERLDLNGHIPTEAPS